MTNDDTEPPGDLNDKLIATKQKWAREGRLLTGTTADPERDRLPPGQRLVRDWPVLDLGAEPNVTPQKFRLDVDGAVENRLSLSLDEFMALPQTESLSDIHCVTQWSRYDNHWKGVAARALLDITATNKSSVPLPPINSPGVPLPPITGFVLQSASFVSPTRGWVLGESPCSTGRCFSLFKTVDAGASWTCLRPVLGFSGLRRVGFGEHPVHRC